MLGQLPLWTGWFVNNCQSCCGAAELGGVSGSVGPGPAQLVLTSGCFGPSDPHILDLKEPALSLICSGSTSSSLSLSVRICIVSALGLLYLMPLTMRCECSVSFLPGIPQGYRILCLLPAREQARESCSRRAEGQIPPLIAGLGRGFHSRHFHRQVFLPSDTPGWKAGAVLRMLELHLPAKTPCCDVVCGGTRPGLRGADLPEL